MRMEVQRPEEIQKITEKMRREILQSIDANQVLTDDELLQLIQDRVLQAIKTSYLSLSERAKVIDDIYNSMRGLDVLQGLLDDPTITEIMINGPDHIFIEQNGRLFQTSLRFSSEERLESVVSTIASNINRTVNEANPICDARLKDGSRVNIVMPPVALNGATVTIRKFPEDPWTIEKLVAIGSLTKEAADFLERLVKAKYNIFVSGGTGTGKTTFLNALSNFIPKDERIITIEDSAELQIKGIANLVRLETKNANLEGKGQITIRDLIKSSLRMRPERIVVGEVRGPEALDMLQAMNTEHDGSLSTGHANCARDILSRLETMVLTGADMPLEAIRQQIASAVDIIIQLSRFRDKSRRVMEIVEVTGYEKGEILLNQLYRFEIEGKTEEKKIIGSLKRVEEHELQHQEKLIQAGIEIY